MTLFIKNKTSGLTARFPYLVLAIPGPAMPYLTQPHLAGTRRTEFALCKRNIHYSIGLTQ